MTAFQNQKTDNSFFIAFKKEYEYCLSFYMEAIKRNKKRINSLRCRTGQARKNRAREKAFF
jgi:hypothetical protein